MLLTLPQRLSVTQETWSLELVLRSCFLNVEIKTSPETRAFTVRCIFGNIYPLFTKKNLKERQHRCMKYFLLINISLKSLISSFTKYTIGRNV